ncbi:flagellar cap protein FliD N-terminal domain-containing protein [Paenarthrobacter ilicis]|uniref:flagellar cap protein FliD N-terminal domain-containing protein n=1 Tax=Paenarthrobacter ilicis TaxID=43665 RepID=UPI003863A0F2
MGTAIDGLVSGLKTTDLINSFMSVEALPQTQLKTKLAANQTIISTLQSFNTKLTALKDLSVAGSAAGALNLFTASSSAPSITAKTTTAASAGSIDLTVTQLAQTQVNVTAAMTAWPPAAVCLTGSRLSIPRVRRPRLSLREHPWMTWFRPSTQPLPVRMP